MNFCNKIVITLFIIANYKICVLLNNFIQTSYDHSINCTAFRTCFICVLNASNDLIYIYYNNYLQRFKDELGMIYYNNESSNEDDNSSYIRSLNNIIQNDIILFHTKHLFSNSTL